MNDNLILVAEDDQDIRDLLALALESAGYVSVHAKDGNTAARIATVARPAGIITDVRMPALNGMELCHLVRCHPDLRHTAVLMTSSSSHPYDIEAGMRAGADDYLPKPVSPRRIVSDMQRLINHRRRAAGVTPADMQ